MPPSQMITNCLHRSRNKDVFAFEGIARQFENYKKNSVCVTI